MLFVKTGFILSLPLAMNGIFIITLMKYSEIHDPAYDHAHVLVICLKMRRSLLEEILSSCFSYKNETMKSKRLLVSVFEARYGTYLAM
jgi:hypothetical protein